MGKAIPQINIMSMNWYILIPVSVAILALVIFIIVQNLKDEQEFEQELNEDYKKPKTEDNNNLDVE